MVMQDKTGLYIAKAITLLAIIQIADGDTKKQAAEALKSLYFKLQEELDK
jgi:hypothetical protein